MIAHIFTYPFNYSNSAIQSIDEKDMILGADRGALFLIENNIRCDVAIGDFDSVTEEELERIKTHAKEIIIHPPKKDETDTMLAVNEAQKRNADKIIIHGGTGGRIDHTFANMLILQKGRITIKTATETLFVLEPGVHKINNHYCNVSFFAVKEVENLSLEGFKYSLYLYNLKTDDPLCVSNEGSGTVKFTQGKLLCILQDS